MEKQKCLSEKSLKTVRKWLLEGDVAGGGDAFLSTRPKGHEKIKRKRLMKKKSSWNGKNWFHWISQLIKQIFSSDEEKNENLQFSSRLKSTKNSSTQTSESSLCPLYCFSVRDGQFLTLKRNSSFLLPSVIRPMSRCSLETINKKRSIIRDTDIYHFDQRNCFIQCRHSSSEEQTQKSDSLCQFDGPEVVFAQSTCQLIKQSWTR